MIAGGNKYNKLLQDFDKLILRIQKSATININESPKEKLERIAYLEKDYGRWFEYYFPRFAKYKCAWFHLQLATLLIRKRRIKELARWFRSAAKSVHIDMGIPLFLYLVRRDLRFMLLIGETEPKACKLLSNIQAELQYNERIKNDYGEKFQGGSWADGDFTTTDGVKFMSIGFMQSPRGAREGAERPDYIVIDDVDNRRHVNNDRMMKEAVDYITEDVWGCFDSADDAVARFVYANNDFHKNSITHRLADYFLIAIKRAQQDGVTPEFDVMTVNAVKDLNTFEPEWPEKTTAEYWKKLYRNTPYRSFLREYMNTHVEDGAVFRHEDILYGAMLPLYEYDSLVCYGDLSYKDAGDYKAMILCGKKGREFHIIHTFLDRVSRTRVAQWLYDLYEKNNLAYYSIKFMIEGLFAMDDFVTDFNLEGDIRGYYIPVVPDKRGKENKFFRIESMSGFFERHNVIFNEAEKGNPYQVTLIDQFMAFCKGSKANDDGPDAVHGAFSELNKSTFVEKFEPQTVSRETLQSKSTNRF